MGSKNEPRLGYAIAIVCLVIGVLCYGAFPAKAPDKPVRVMFQAMGGNVLFNHQAHMDDYGLECDACHHLVNGNQSDAMCETCHRKGGEYKPALGKKGLFDHQAHSDDYGLECSECHHTYSEGDTEDPESCGACHQPGGEDETIPGRVDAFHKQCIGCHEDSGVTPGQSDCTGCHKPRKQKDAFHEQCMNCHEDSGAGPTGSDCKTCHGY